MPRIYADVMDHSMDWGEVDFLNGVAAVAVGANTAYFVAASYAIDTNKNALSYFDKLSRADLDELANYLGVTFTEETTKQALVRLVETTLSAKYITALTVASTAGTAMGGTNIAVTGEIGTEGNTLKYKVGVTAPTALFRDIAGSTWTTITDGADIAGLTAGQFITIVEVNAAGEVLAIGNDEIVVRTV